MLAMRPAPFHRESRHRTEKPQASAAPTGMAAKNSTCDAAASQDLDTQIAQARRDARRNPAQAAMLLRSWMSDHG
jgi:flagellar biosynthesis/type III secretory pathway M-ring protein FliF/YscJ